MRPERVVTYLSIINVSIILVEKVLHHVTAFKKSRNVEFGFQAATGKKSAR